MPVNQPLAEIYTISDAEAQRLYTGVRRAAQWTPFLLPHLRPGMSLLDCGCGAGSITLDLAEFVAPGSVGGLDLDVGQLDAARWEAARRGLTNVTFEHGNVYNLPFADGAFDAALAHTLLFHLRARSLRSSPFGACWRRAAWLRLQTTTTVRSSIRRMIPPCSRLAPCLCGSCSTTAPT